MIQVDKRDLADFHKEIERMRDALDRKKVNSIKRRNAKPMLNDMKANSKSVRIAEMTAITTRQHKRPRAPRIGIRIGVINNDTSKFPKFTAPALASVIEHGTAERYRTLKAFGFITGRQSTGAMPAAPWLRPAWDRHIESFLRKTEKDMMDKVTG